MRAVRAALAALAAVGALAACAGARVDRGVYRSPKGYSIAIPATDWTVIGDDRADLELRHREAPAGMLANAACGDDTSRRPLGLLTRHLLLGLRDRAVLEEDEVAINGRPAAHSVVEGRMERADGRMRVEAYVIKAAACVYDFLYAAPPPLFERWRADFRRFVESFVAE